MLPLRQYMSSLIQLFNVDFERVRHICLEGLFKCFLNKPSINNLLEGVPHAERRGFMANKDKMADNDFVGE